MCAVAGFGIGGVSQVVNKGYPKTQAHGCDCGSCAMAGFGICSLVRFCYSRELEFMEIGSDKGGAVGSNSGVYKNRVSTTV